MPFITLDDTRVQFGKAWHDGGRKRNKIVTFADYIHCAEKLIAMGYTKPALLFADGAYEVRAPYRILFYFASE